MQPSKTGSISQRANVLTVSGLDDNHSSAAGASSDHTALNNSAQKLNVSSTMDITDQKESGTYIETNKWVALIRSCIVEFIGDLLFIFIGTLQGSSGAGVTGAAFAHGVTIFVLVAGMGHISGGHFNPAVTLGVLVSGNISIISSIFYMLSQILGGFIGSLFAKAALGGSFASAFGGGLTLPGKDVYPLEAIVIEILLTYFLVSTVLMTAVDNDKNILAPVAIGFSILADIFAGGNLSGASMNPARSIGPAVSWLMFGDDKAKAWSVFYIYLIGPFAGAVIAALIYKPTVNNASARSTRS